MKCRYCSREATYDSKYCYVCEDARFDSAKDAYDFCERVEDDE